MRNCYLVLVAVPVMVAACSSGSDAGRSAPEPSAPAIDQAAGAASIDAVEGPAKKFVQINAEMDTKWNLLARKFFNNDTEVVSFYEPTPGNVIAVAAGHPTGAAMLKPSSDSVELWGKDAMPTPLVEALARRAAGVGVEHFATSHPVNESASVASSVVPETSVAAPAGVTPFVVGTGYCDTQWKSDFPTNLTGVKTSYCSLTGFVHYPPAASNGAVPQWVGDFSAPSNQAEPYNSGAGCTCSCRNVVGFQQIHFNPAAVSNHNEWENFGVVCPPLGAATVTVAASNENFTFTVPEDFYSWVEDVGSVSCFFTTCTSTNDIGSWSMTARSQRSGGLVNGLFSAYGP